MLMSRQEPPKPESPCEHFFLVIDRGATVLGPFLSYAEAAAEGRRCRGYTEFVVMQFPASGDFEDDGR